MSVGSPTHSYPTDQYTWLKKGTRLWHVYPDSFDCLAFNPKSTNRFALPPPPDCAMFYAADSAACALWESVLRNLVIGSAQLQPVATGLLAGRSIVELEVVLDTKILDLRSPYFRKLGSDPALHAELQRLAIVPEAQYGETHAKARALRDRWGDSAGLCWFSRQIGARSVYVFYRPPHPVVGFRKIKAHSLDTKEGWALIDAALEIVGVKRLGPTM